MQLSDRGLLLIVRVPRDSDDEVGDQRPKFYYRRDVHKQVRVAPRDDVADLAERGLLRCPWQGEAPFLASKAERDALVNFARRPGRQRSGNGTSPGKTARNISCVDAAPVRLRSATAPHFHVFIPNSLGAFIRS
jgi:hypothetical protein